MQWLGVTDTVRFNKRHLRTGHLFQAQFKSILVENDAYVVQLSCYIDSKSATGWNGQTVDRLPVEQ